MRSSDAAIQRHDSCIIINNTVRSPLTSDRIIKKTDEHLKTSPNTPLERWIQNGGTPGTLDPFGVLYQTIRADCQQNRGDPDVTINLVVDELIKLSKEEMQRMLGDNTYYVELLKMYE